MGQQHQLNGTNISYIGQAQWSDAPQGEYLGGDEVLGRWKQHTWTANVMTAATFDTLYAQQGQTVTLTTTDYNDRNGANYKTYYNAILTGVTGQHNGPNVEQVKIDFTVAI